MTSLDSSNISHAHVKAEALSMQDLSGLIKAHLKVHIKQWTFEMPRIDFTDIDKAFLIWGLLCIPIFSMAQFSALTWTSQSVIDAALTGLGLIATSGITWKVASEGKLRWVIYLWTVLMGLGMLLTAYGIFYGVGVILTHLCLMWLVLCSLGYGVMAIRMRSRCFTAASLFHLLSIGLLSYQPSWQFFNTGLVMSATLFIFSVVHWDMQEPDAA